MTKQEQIDEVVKEMYCWKCIESKRATYTQDQVRDLVVDVFAELIIKLKDPSLVIVGMLACDILDKKLK